ncbi:BA14K family protein [Sinorhizobium garamanticum]|uniref:BA14K family protein n=1 Tax=Sinorhizobium garamanticum TaxID=680247 RepID=A0ABY8DC88_9HYPH|nr:BA14K family protein [Sinorhizobium garamanticum]WEX88500.1 BA14K family protein [Sinorhizobium garamanticum]
MIPPVAPAQAMPRPVLDIGPPADVQTVTHRRWGSYPRWRGGYYGGWPGYHPGYRRAGISFYFGPGAGYYPRRHYYGTRYYGPGYYPGYYPYRYHRGYYPYRYGPGYYGHRYYRPGYYGGVIVRGW